MTGQLFLIHEHNDAISNPRLWDRNPVLARPAPRPSLAGISPPSGSPRSPSTRRGEDMSQMATKLVGPLPSAQAREIIDRLRWCWKRRGCPCSSKKAADD